MSFCTERHVMLLIWKDKREVRMLSAVYGVTILESKTTDKVMENNL